MLGNLRANEIFIAIFKDNFMIDVLPHFLVKALFNFLPEIKLYAADQSKKFETIFSISRIHRKNREKRNIDEENENLNFGLGYHKANITIKASTTLKKIGNSFYMFSIDKKGERTFEA